MKTLTALLMLSVATMPVYAQTDPTTDPTPAPDPVVVEANRQAAQSVARTTAIEERTALINANIAALGLTNTATGTTTLKPTAGELEAWMLSAQALDQAAKTIAAAANAARGTRKVVLLAGDEAFDLSIYTVVKARLEAIKARFSPVPPQARCVALGAATARPAAASSLSAIIPLAGALIGALRSDTEISPAAGPTDARLLINAIAQRNPTAWIVPADLSVIPAGSELNLLWDEVKTKRAAAAACALELAKNDANKNLLAQITAAMTAVDDFETHAVQGDAGSSLLIQAIRAETIIALKPLILRVYVEKAGGTILLRKNLWTMLGAPAVGITGAAVVSWRMADPTSGGVFGGGMLICRSALTNLRAIHQGATGAKACVASAN